MERPAHRLGARHAPLHRAMYALVLLALALAGALIPQMTPVAHAAYAVTGMVYRDYNANGARDTREPGVGGVPVIAYDDSGAAVATTTSSATFATLGQYTLNIPNDNPVRIEFGGLPSGFLSGPHGGQSNTSVAFASGQATIDFAINRPSQYCQSNPDLVTNCYVRGYQLSQSNPVVVSFPYSSGGTTPADFDNPNTHAMMITSDQVGTTWGLAYQRASNSLFAAAFMKRHTGFGPNGPGAIYRIDPSANTAGLFLDIDALLGPGTTGGDPHPPGVTPDYIADGWYRDANAWDPVGKRSLGDLDPSEDEQTLYTVNLATRELYAIPIGSPPVAPTLAAQIGRFPVPTPNGPGICPSADDIRPFGLGVYDGLVYVGMVCSAESTQLAADLRAFVYSFDPATSNFSAAPVLQFSLNYPRRCGDNSPNGPGGTPPCPLANWRPWVTTFTLNLYEDPLTLYPEPWLTDIVFDNGAMIVGLRDRYGDQTGHRSGNTDPADPKDYNGLGIGDIVRACPNGAGGWDIENNALCGGISTAGAGSAEGPGGGEYYYQENHYWHDEISLAGLVQIPGFPDVAETVFDPVSGQNQIYDGGVLWFDDTAGTRTRTYRLFNGDDPPDPADPTLGKANGLGDLEGLCNAAPLEIGNRVWLDTNRDGFQDPGETPIAGVVVRLYDAGGNLVATTTTNAGGEYYFDATNVPGGIQPNTSYEIRIDTVQPALAGLFPTTPNASANSLDQRDSDGLTIGNGTDVGTILTTGTAGDNNHTYDFGFNNQPLVVVLSSFSATPEGDRIVVRWTTAAERDTLGFYLHRSVDRDRSHAVLITPDLIPAGGHGGAQYRWTDADIQPGITYRYWLEEVELNGRRNEYGPVTPQPQAIDEGAARMFLPLIRR